jgi:hypothetical protein
MIVVTAEDRPGALVGLKVLALSLARHCPGVELHVFAPAFPVAFERWAGGQRALCLHQTPPGWPSSWSIKPAALLDRLDAGGDAVVWLDADIVLTRDVRATWSRVPAETMMVATETRWPGGGDGSRARTAAFGLEVGRVFPRAINSSVIRVTSAHRSLITAWRDLLQEPAYLDAQARPIEGRPRHLVGDQDALAALIGSARFADLPVKLLEPPSEILHAAWGAYDAYPLAHRLRHVIGGLPPVVHALGRPKPWDAASAGRLSAGLSPYCAVASEYSDALDEPAPWLRPTTTFARACQALTLGHPALRDLPATLAVAVAKRHS